MHAIEKLTQAFKNLSIALKKLKPNQHLLEQPRSKYHK